jgi:hypothetical protein
VIVGFLAPPRTHADGQMKPLATVGFRTVKSPELDDEEFEDRWSAWVSHLRHCAGTHCVRSRSGLSQSIGLFIDARNAIPVEGVE